MNPARVMLEGVGSAASPPRAPAVRFWANDLGFPGLSFLIHQMGIMLGLPLPMGNEQVKKCKVFSTEQGT